MKSLPILLCATVLATILPLHAQVSAAEEKVQRPQFTPQLTLDASFVDKTRYAIFEPGEKTDLWLRVLGWRKDKEELLWEVRDFEGVVKDSGSIEVPAGDKAWEGVLNLKPYGYGYFEVHLRLKHADISVPRAGSRPAGYVSYGVLPDVQRLPLQWVDDSRFGAQGTNFLETGKFMQGNPYRPLYPTLGLVWVYDGYRMGEREGKGPGTFQPITDPEVWKTRNDYWAEAGLCPIIDLHGLPDWLIGWPEGKDKAYAGPTNSGQAYAPNDWDAFANYIRNVAKEQVARRKALFPKLKHNYYQIHWEPDWHWKGEDKDFIRMYEVAHRAIREADPDGMLLGPNYGVLKTGNEHLERMLKKGLGKYLDGIATHTYYIPFGFPEPRDLPAQVRDLVRMTREHLAPGAKIINTEWGTDYHGKSIEKNPGVMRDEMAEFMRGHLITLGEGVDCTWYFYTADMQGQGGLMYNLTTPNPVFGAIWISPKPIAMAAGAATKLLEGTKTLGPVTYLDEHVLAYLFDRNGDRLLALWSPDGQTRDIAIPVGESTVTHYDAMGNATPVGSVGGMATVTVTDVPTYVAGLPPVMYSTKTLAGDPLPQGLPGGETTIPGLNGPALAYRHGDVRKLEVKDGQLTVPRDLPPGDWFLAAGDGLAKTPGQATILHVSAPVSIAEKKDGAAAGFPFELKNRLASEVQGALRFRGNGQPVSGETVTLKPGATTTVTMPTEALASAGGDAPVRVEFVDAEGVVSPGPKLQGLFTNAAMATKPVETDGLMKDWLLEMFTTYNTAADMRAGASEWGGPEDLMFRIGFRYDANRLYIGIKVRDQSHVQEKDGSSNWQQDSVQLGIASVPGEKGWTYAQKIAISLRDGDEVINVYREPHTSGLTGGPINPSKFKTKVLRQGDETFYFLAIPWEEIVPGQKGIPEARRIAVGVFVNDVDRVGSTLTKRKVMEGFGEGMGFFLPENFTTVNLSGEP